MGRQYNVVTEKQFDFSDFLIDLKNWCKHNNETLATLSAYGYKGANYIQNSCVKQRMPKTIIDALCNITGIDAECYENDVDVKEAQETAITTFIPAQGWSCDCKVHEDTRSCEFALYKDGNLVTRTFSRINFGGGKDVRIAQAISYAAHMAYKQVEQMDFLTQRVSKKED